MKKEFKLAFLYYKRDNIPLGDYVIYDTSCFLFNQIGEKLGKKIFIEPYTIDNDKLGSNITKKYKYMATLFEYKFNFSKKVTSNIFFFINIIEIFFKLQSDKNATIYYRNMVKNSDYIVFCGGGIFEHEYLYYWVNILAILVYCLKYNKKMIFNSMGIKKSPIFIENLLNKFLLSNPFVEICSARYNIEFAKQMNKNCKLIVDNALWSSECYKISRKQSDVIGLNIVRKRIFGANGINTSESQIINMYTGIKNELLRRGYKVQLFVNGPGADYVFAQELIELWNDKNITLESTPTTTRELVETISQYKGIVCSRLHASIIATSLNIPTIQLVWNEKFINFANLINQKGKPITFDKFDDAVYIVDEFEKSLNAGVDTELVENLKNQSYDKMKVYIAKLFR